jgi:hypothetical protein
MRSRKAWDRQCCRLRATGALLIAVLALGSLTTEAAAQTQGAEAKAREAITVQGNLRIDAETVRSYFHANSDGRFDEVARDAALKALLATGLFDKVTIEPAGEHLVVHLTEAPVLDLVAFEGNKKVNDADLTAAVESKPRGTLQRALVQSDIGRILEAYRHVGRDDVRVRPEIIEPRQQPRRSRLCRDRRCQDPGAADRVHRQQGIRKTAAQCRDQDLPHLAPEFSDPQRRLRPRPRRRRSRAVAAVLPRQGLCRRQRGRGQGRIRSRDARILR